MRDIYVEDFESEPFMTAFKAYFSEISGGTRYWPMLFRQMNAEKDVTKAIMRLDGDTVVGFILFCPLQLTCPFFTESYGYIRELWVAPAYRRAGNGRELMAFSEQYFSDLGMSQIMLKAEPRAEDFYRKLGYAISDTASSEGETVYFKKIR
ncbi:MAG: GNAT family N-acetyltransferase [Clostridia bacterium]|nr:GNAT family N-acetyltransferase [Clostridia bacterium]